MELLAYNYDGVLLEENGLQSDDLGAIASDLEAARAEVLDDGRRWAADDAPPPNKVPLDAGFLDLPDRMLTDLREHEDVSELGRIRSTADRLAESADRVVVLGIGGSYMGARAIFEALCHPFHNELPRDQRTGTSRIYFEGNNVDNDVTTGLVELLGRGARATGPDDQFALVPISKSGGTLETAVAFRQFLRLLELTCGQDRARVAELVVPVTGASGRLRELAEALGCPDVFQIPEGVGGRFSIFTAVGLLPAAVLGVDIVKLIQGAATMNQHFRTAPVRDNVVLNYVAVCHLMEKLRGASIRVLSTWGKRLEGLGLWYDQLLSESLGKAGRGATPITFVGTRDLHSRGQQHQEGRRDKLITNLLVTDPQREPITVGPSEFQQDGLNHITSKTFPEVLAAAIEGTNKAYRDDNRPTATLTLPQLDAATLGQLLQMFMLATVVEGRLIGINPFGQPGVEAYKRNMNAILKK